MNTVGITEARTKLSALLREVEAGGDVIVTRRGKPVARLEPTSSGFDRAKARRAADGLRAASKGHTRVGPSRP